MIQPILEKSEFLSADSLDSLFDRLRAAGCIGHDAALLELARENWAGLAQEEASRASAAVSLTHEVEVSGARLRVTGLLMAGPPNWPEGYAELVRPFIDDLQRPFVQRGLEHFFEITPFEIMPDDIALGWGRRVGDALLPFLSIPAVLIELWRAIRGERKVPPSPLPLARRFSLEPDLRLGLLPEPYLPARLEAEAQLKRWSRDSLVARLMLPQLPAATALFLCGMIEEHRASQSEMRDVVVAETLLPFVLYFLAGAWNDHPLRQAGRDFAKLSGEQRRGRAGCASLSRALLALGGCLLSFVAVLATILGLVWWLW